LPVYRKEVTGTTLASLQLLLGFAALHQGDYRLLHAIFREAVTDTHITRFSRKVSLLLLLIAASFAAQGQERRATRLLGALEAAGASGIEDSSLRVFAGLLDQYLAHSREHLGDAAWRAAWEEGQGMTLQEAVADALDDSLTSYIAIPEGEETRSGRGSSTSTRVVRADLSELTG
jgi:hypothetical protein